MRLRKADPHASQCLTPAELAFLPAAQSLEATPPRPLARWAALTTCAFFLLALAWSIVGQLDIVAVATGRIVVTDQTKVIQPLETAVVRRILVRNGDCVKTGQVLVELDPSMTQADRQRVAADLASAIADEWRNDELLGRLRRFGVGAPLEPIQEGTDLDRRRRPRADGHPGAGPGTPDDRDDFAVLAADQRAQARRRLDADWRDIHAQLDKLDAEAAHRQAEAATASAQVDKLTQTLPMLQQREKDFEALAAQSFISAHATQDRTRERLEMEHDLELAQARRVETRAGVAESAQARRAYLADTEKNVGDSAAQAHVKHLQLAEDQAKADRRHALTRLTAPVDGTVQQVDISTDGGVVTDAQKLMIIVPSGAPITAEVVIDNQDIGFVKTGQPAQVKLETFDFTRYGTLPAIVERISGDAVADEKRGAIFPATLRLKVDTIRIDEHVVHLTPGMNVTSEIRIGRRRVIHYLLGPLLRATSESMREM